MNEFIEKLIEKFLIELKRCEASHSFGEAWGMKCAIKITQELAEEYKGGWIKGRVPTKEECGRFERAWFLVTIPQYDGNATVAMQYEYTTVRGKEVSRWLWYGRIAGVEPIAWRPLPEPYQPKGE